MHKQDGQSPAALITGAALRTGKSIAMALAECGFDVAIHYHHSDTEAKDLITEIEAISQRCTLIRCDLTNMPEVRQVIPYVHSQLPGLSLLINNASIFNDASFLDTTEELFDQNFKIHVKAPFFLTLDFARICKHGHVVNILDTAVNRNATECFAYLLSKKTLRDFTDMAALELAPDIRVNAIAPGSILEPINDLHSNYMKKRALQVPLKMKGSPDYVVQGIRYLLENPFVTGECLFIDGGVHIQM